MTTAMNLSAPELEPERCRARNEFVSGEGNYWLKRHAPELAKLPDGTALVINVANGDYVTAPTRLEAMDKFDQKFGVNTTFGFIHQIGRPIFIGGGGVV
jgi:hypothetical protein